MVKRLNSLLEEFVAEKKRAIDKPRPFTIGAMHSRRARSDDPCQVRSAPRRWSRRGDIPVAQSPVRFIAAVRGDEHPGASYRTP